MNRRLFRTTVSTALVAALVAFAPGSAGAATKTFKDSRHDTASSNNIVRYTVHNGKRIKVTTKHKNLTKKAVDIQFRIKSKGVRGSYVVYASTNGKVKRVYFQKWVGQKCKGVKVNRNLKKDRLSLSVPRKCVGNPKGKIRVKVRVQWSADGTKGDWAPDKGYSPWVRR